jgi:serine/threonine protein kinase
MPSGVPKLIGRYRIERLLGQGGMGLLYLAIDPALGRRLAIKLLRDDSPELRERFSREARAAATLNHRHIVGIYDVGDHEGQPFIAMEYLEGRTLAEIMVAGEAGPLSRRLAIVEAICDGLAHAHRHGVIHRDVKPANVMIASDGAVKVMDFGIARIGSVGVTQAGSVLGSPGYMAPEQIRGQETDARTDVFAVGTILYELIAGRNAYAGSDPMAVMWKVVNEPPESLGAVVPGIDPALVVLVDRAMARDPSARFDTIDQVQAELRRIRDLLPLDLALPPPAPAPPPSPSPSPTLPGLRSAQTFVAPPAPVPSSGFSETMYLRSPDPVASATGQMPAVQLVVLRTGDPRMNGRVVPVNAPEFSIGRDASCNLSLAEPSLSRRHAIIQFGPAGFLVKDGESANGTFLNGRRIVEAGELLTFGATLQLGDTAMTFGLANEVPLPDMTGAVVAGRYELIALMRSGAKGAMYEGRDLRLNRQVAVKLMSPDLMRLDAYRHQFDREATIGATLHHPHICEVLDRGEDEVALSGGPRVHVNYLCLEIMTGGSLAGRMQEGPLPLDQIAAVITSVGEALDYSHRRGVVHGDVKPSAIVFNEDGHAFLTDFSFAQRALTRSDAGLLLGSPPYVAPEVWDHGALTSAADQFALAVVAYYVITGALPFAGQENPEVRRRNFARGPLAAHQEASAFRSEAVPRAVSAVLIRALSGLPQQRFESSVAFAQALTEGLKGRRIDRGGVSIFLSYQRDMSSGWANYFAKELQDHGIATFVDVQRLDRAQRFPDRLTRAIEECDVFVCLLGETTLQSPWVVEEIRQAHKQGKPMVPIFQESFDPAGAREPEPAVDALLAHDAVHLFDERNVHVQHTAADLAMLVKNTLNRN